MVKRFGRRKLNKIVLENIGMKYILSEESHKVLDEINLSIAEGDFVSITGKSGSGKTTLLNIMGGLLNPSSGRLLLNHNEIKTVKERNIYRRKYVSFVFQFFNLLPSLNVEENISIQYDLLGKKYSKRRLDYLISYLGLDHCRYKLPTVLSGGEQQRVAIARSVFSESKFIFADEPTHSLDEENSEKVIDLLENINCRHNRALVIATHDSKVAKIADRHLELCDGKIKERRTEIEI